MNRLVKWVVIVLITIIAMSCKEIALDEPQVQDYFMKFYGNYHNDNLYDIKLTQNEEIVLAGYRQMSDESEKAWIIKTKVDGMVDWEKEFSGTNNYRGYGLYIDNLINFAAYEFVPGSTTQKGFLCQYNMDGTLVDSLSFDILADHVKDIKFLTNNSNLRFIVHVSLNNNDEIYIYELTSSNEINLISANNLYRTVVGSLYFYEQGNGDLYLTGSFEEVDNPGYTDILVSRIIDDNIIWSYQKGESGAIEETSGIVLLNNALYVSATKHSDLESTDGSLYLIKMDASGLSDEEIEINLEGDNTSYNMIVNSEEEFVLVGDRKIDDKISKIFMVRISLEGQILLENEYGNVGDSHGRFVKKLPEAKSGFVIAGNIATSTDEDAKDIIVIKADELGEWIF
ncbi:MAG: hypothetical protein JEY96_00740 [Bacteroidales bacterium]|nr:hypothetical protein [Bacteroidales bacterium]